jgi:hypothetical protein
VSACLSASQERQPSRASERLPVSANKRLFAVFSCHSGRGAQRVGGCWSTPLPRKRFSARRSPAARPAAATADHKHLLPVPPPLVPPPAACSFLRLGCLGCLGCLARFSPLFLLQRRHMISMLCGCVASTPTTFFLPSFDSLSLFPHTSPLLLHYLRVALLCCRDVC